MTKLDSLELPSDLQWTDETAWSPVEENQEYSLAGSLIGEAGVKLAGRPITLVGGERWGWVTWATITELMEMAAVPNKKMLLTLNNGRVFNVKFNYSGGGPITSTPIDDLHPPRPEHNYFITLRLTEV